MDEGQRVLCQIETKESLSSIKSGLANLIQCAKDFKNTALENHLVAIQNERETNTDNALEVKIYQSCRKTMSNEMYKRSRGEKAWSTIDQKSTIRLESKLYVSWYKLYVLW